MPKIIVPAVLRARMNEPLNEVEVEGATVGDALQGLANRHPELADILFVNDTLHPSLCVFLDNRAVPADQYLTEAVESDAEIMLVPPIAGG